MDSCSLEQKGLAKLMNAMRDLEKLSPSKKSSYNVDTLEKKCFTAMDDDFNTPILIAHLFDGVKIINSVKSGKKNITADDLKKLKSIFHIFVLDILGLTAETESGNTEFANKIMELILKLRNNAKSNKDYTTADLIRDELNKLNIQIKDDRKGSTWENNS